jgi:hemerythrin-like domain-containing protein
MKRDPALASLSRDHHLALVVGQNLRQVSGDSRSDAREAALTYWRTHGRTHFRLEEEVLFPAYAGHGDPHHPLLARALCEHAVIRHQVDAIARDPRVKLDALRDLGVQLSDHVRLEERKLFPLIERSVPAAELMTVALALSEAERKHHDE